jgi:hypothetical protein
MDLKSAGQMIRDTVSMETVLGMYGLEVGRGGFMVCPFHGERDASLKVYRSRDGHHGWHCFGCGRGGSVIDFVMAYEECSYADAVKKIDNAAGTGYTAPSGLLFDMSERFHQRKYDAVKWAFEAYLKAIDEEIERDLAEKSRQAGEIEAIPKQDRSWDNWYELTALNEEMDYLDYLRERVREVRREVSEWRKTKRTEHLRNHQDSNQTSSQVSNQTSSQTGSQPKNEKKSQPLSGFSGFSLKKLG